jgi:DNA-binding FadR family transcriptional regulator
MRFHAFINELSGNSLIGETTAPHWPYLRRVMGEVLRDDAQMPETILSEHVEILDAVIAGDGARAEMLSRNHISRAAKIFVQRLQAQQEAEEEEVRKRRTRRIR